MSKEEAETTQDIMNKILYILLYVVILDIILFFLIDDHDNQNFFESESSYENETKILGKLVILVFMSLMKKVILEIEQNMKT